MIYRAENQFSQKLLSLPETGMGFQIVDVTRLRPGLYYSINSRVVVYNGELIIEMNDYFENNKRRVINEGFNKVLNSVDSIGFTNPHLINLSEIRGTRTFSNATMDSFMRTTGGSGASDNPPQKGNGTDIFVRLSAYKDDKRIDFLNNRLRPGSYATTYLDYQRCKSFKDDPIDRYALPNNEKIKYEFHFQPKEYDMYRKGIVQPANNHNGGGVEVLFDSGTSNGTLIKESSY